MFPIQFISHCTDSISYLQSVESALEGGCRWIQLRVKNATDAQVMPLAMQCMKLCREAGATFIIDDRVGLAAAIGADGVHLGKEDMPIYEARKILGSKAIIGATANTVDDIRYLCTQEVDYIGCGPFRHTDTKERLAPVLGETGYRRIISMMRQEAIDLPIIGIGGITAEDILLLKEIGLSGIALSGSVLRATDPIEEMRRIMTIAKNP